MDATDRGDCDCSGIYFCGLEWVTWAIDAAREYIECATAERPADDNYYADRLLVSWFDEEATQWK